MPTHLPARRLAGLDTLRALAVTLVVLHHYTLFVTRDHSTFGWVGKMGWAGVDLFFALSGYLIGRQIFAALRDPRGLSLGRFYARRLLRTLPNLCGGDAVFFAPRLSRRSTLARLVAPADVYAQLPAVARHRVFACLVAVHRRTVLHGAAGCRPAVRGLAWIDQDGVAGAGVTGHWRHAVARPALAPGRGR
jgi:hypothetical protein